MRNPKKKLVIQYPNNRNSFKAFFLAFCLLSLVGCSSNSKSNGNGGNYDDDPITQIDTTVFTVIGDVPYDDEERTGLISLIATHNTRAKSEFVVHIGDIKPGSAPCDESVYQDVSTLLKEFETPTFIVLGDNEYNDCEDPAEGLSLWNRYFLHLNENWSFQPTVEYQEVRPENFGWVQNKVLFLGVNIVGSSVHDETEWQTRLTDDAQWVSQQVSKHKDDIEALVVFGHANMVETGPAKFRPFTDVFRATAKSFGKPVLYMQGDGHLWFQNRPYDEKNILRVQVDSGPTAVEVTVNPNLEQPFLFNRTFLD